MEVGELDPECFSGGSIQRVQHILEHAHQLRTAAYRPSFDPCGHRIDVSRGANGALRVPVTIASELVTFDQNI